MSTILRAFPFQPVDPRGEPDSPEYGMTLRDWFAGQALSCRAICNGEASRWELDKWFGPHRSAITRPEIIAKQALEFADAMLAERSKQEQSS